MTTCDEDVPYVSAGVAAWRGTRLAAALTCAGQLGFVLLDRDLGLPRALWTMRIGHALIAAIVLVGASALRARPVRDAELAFLALALPYVPVFWLAESAMLASGRLWAPFVGYELVMIAIALLAPGRARLGASLIAVLAVEAAVSWFVLGIGESPSAAAAAQPWIVMIFALVSAVLLGFRERHQRLVIEYERARAEARSVEDLARVALAVRDMANTPLQSMQLALALFEQGDRDPKHVVAPVSRAVARMRDLNRLLSRYERWVDWSDDAESFAPEARLAQVEARLEAARAGGPPEPTPDGARSAPRSAQSA